jgi:hypothetical protein
MNYNIIKGWLIVLLAKIDFPAVASRAVRRKMELFWAFSDLPYLLRKVQEDIFNLRRVAAICPAKQHAVFVFLSQFA